MPVVDVYLDLNMVVWPIDPPLPKVGRRIFIDEREFFRCVQRQRGQ